MYPSLPFVQVCGGVTAVECDRAKLAGGGWGEYGLFMRPIKPALFEASGVGARRSSYSSSKPPSCGQPHAILLVRGTNRQEVPRRRQRPASAVGPLQARLLKQAAARADPDPHLCPRASRPSARSPRASSGRLTPLARSSRFAHGASCGAGRGPPSLTDAAGRLAKDADDKLLRRDLCLAWFLLRSALRAETPRALPWDETCCRG
eukprot:scaffold1439_cov404-Prasinococcus_capsulatus_cf.AAC.26